MIPTDVPTTIPTDIPSDFPTAAPIDPSVSPSFAPVEDPVTIKEIHICGHVMTEIVVWMITGSANEMRDETRSIVDVSFQTAATDPWVLLAHNFTSDHMSEYISFHETNNYTCDMSQSNYNNFANYHLILIFDIQKFALSSLLSQSLMRDLLFLTFSTKWNLFNFENMNNLSFSSVQEI